QGGNPLTGMVSGISSSVTASSVQSIGSQKIATLIGGTLAGGVGATVVGGDFYQGALFGLISTSLNHLAHETQISIIESINERNHGDPPTLEDLKKNPPNHPDYK